MALFEDPVKQEIEEEKQARLIFRGQLGTPAGCEVLAWILNECGYWAMDPQCVKPELVALANRLLARMGIIHPRNLRVVAEKLMEAATDDDLREGT